jgi:hypothetical protein
MTVLAYILSYLFIGLLSCVLVTYLDVKHDFTGSRYRGRNDNAPGVVSFLVWPVAIPVIILIFSGVGINSAINKLRKLFE